MTDPSGPPPSYDEVQGLPPQGPGGFPQAAPYPDANKLAGYSAYPGQGVPYPTDSSGQPYPTQPGYTPGQYPYGQSGAPPPQPPGMTYPPQGQYMHPAAVAYNPQQGGVVVQQGGPMANGVFGGRLVGNRRKRILLSIIIAVIIFVFFTILMNIIF